MRFKLRTPAGSRGSASKAGTFPTFGTSRRLRNAVEWVWEQKGLLSMAAGQIGRLVTDVRDDRVTARLDGSPHRRLEVGR